MAATYTFDVFWRDATVASSDAVDVVDGHAQELVYRPTLHA